MLLFWPAWSAYEHQPVVPSLHARGGATADLAWKEDRWFRLLESDTVLWSARTSASTLLLPRPQMVKTNLVTDVAWSIKRASGDGLCNVTARASELRVDVSCDGEPRTALVGSWKESASNGIKVYMRASILHLRGVGWETNATRKRVYTQVSGSAPWRYDLTLRALSPQMSVKGVLGEAWASNATQNGAHDDYGERVDNSRYEVVTATAQGEGILRRPLSEYEVAEPLVRTFGSVMDGFEVRHLTSPSDVGWY